MVEVYVYVSSVVLGMMPTNPDVENMAAIEDAQLVSATASVAVEIEYQRKDHGQDPPMVPPATWR